MKVHDDVVYSNHVDMGNKVKTIIARREEVCRKDDAYLKFMTLTTLVPKLSKQKKEEEIKFLRKQEQTCEVFPKKTFKDSFGNLHSMSGPAVLFGGGIEMYYIAGVKFDKDSWSKLTTDPSLVDLMSITNIEDRMRVLRALPFRFFVDKGELLLLDKSDRGNELYKLDLNKFFANSTWRTFKNEDHLYVARYWCHSTDREYVSFVSPKAFNDIEKPLADEALAWKHHYTLEEYNNLKVES